MTAPYAVRNARRHATKQTVPYFAQARTWYRYARYLKHRTFDAYQKKEEALAHSRRLHTRALVIPAILDLSVQSGEGLRRLRRWLEEEGVRYPELAARIAQVDDDDPAQDEVYLFLEESDRTSSRGRRYFVGRLPQEDACWALPLLRIETDAYGTGPVLRFFVERGRVESTTAASEVRVVIAHAHEAAAQFFDWKDERKQCFDERYRVTYYDERAYAPVAA